MNALALIDPVMEIFLYFAAIAMGLVCEDHLSSISKEVESASPPAPDPAPTSTPDPAAVPTPASWQSGY
ncbi:MAG: hypothetical protein NT154_12910 [Verrucomicrobia bacterium]|nr:hypothetical protein [Verrucomicrobiota bacterium]